MSQRLLGDQCAGPATDQTQQLQGTFTGSPGASLRCRFIEGVGDKANQAQCCVGDANYYWQVASYDRNANDAQEK